MAALDGTSRAADRLGRATREGPTGRRTAGPSASCAAAAARCDPWSPARADATPSPIARDRPACRSWPGRARRLGGAVAERAAPRSRPARAERSRRARGRGAAARPRVHVRDGQPRRTGRSGCVLGGATRASRCSCSSSSGTRAAGVDTLRGVGVLRYELHPPHRHWHLDDFVRYELRSLDGEVVVRDRKSGFCLIDRWGYARRAARPPAAAAALRRRLRHAAAECPSRRGGLLGRLHGSIPGVLPRPGPRADGAAGRPVPARADREPRAPAPGARLREQRRVRAPPGLVAVGAGVGAAGPGAADGAAGAPYVPAAAPDVPRGRGAYDPAAWSASTSSSSVPVPAGSSTAIHLARSGVRVLVAEKARFPRDKPCGGGLTGRALKRIPVDPSPVVERDVDRFELRLRYGSSFARSHDEPLIRMTQRRRLDAFLAEQAAEAGAEVREGARVERLEGDESGVTALVDGTPVRADVVVGADGANGVVARSFGLGRGHRPRCRARGEHPARRARQRSLAHGGHRARGRAGRVRLGVPEGRPRQPRRRRVGERGSCAARPPRTALPRARRRPGST